MVWSYSSSRAFLRCQRQWFFAHKYSHHGSKDPQRWEAYLLSKLQSLEGWRGSLVDDVISRRVVYGLNHGSTPSLAEALSYAKRLFESQYSFAAAHRLREPGLRPAQVGDEFAAFHALEYDLGLTEEDRKRAWTDIEDSLTNFFAMSELWEEFQNGTYLIAQRPLSFRQYLQDIPVKAFPDLIVFYASEPPLIIDWKVNTFGTRSYRLQLSVYAVALTLCKPHIDFPVSPDRFNAADVRLIEAQLLTNQLREYSLSDTDVEDVHSYIAYTASKMKLASGHKSSNLSPYDFLVTNKPDTCQRCAYRTLCWKEQECLD